MTRNSTEYVAGFKANEADKDYYFDNPYLAGSESWVAWRNGWEDSDVGLWDDTMED